MLVHICCSVDSHYFLQKLQKEFPHKELIGFFYDPNIHPYSEYYLRLLDVKRSCRILDIKLIEGDYDVDSWLKSVKGLENEPEKGARCEVCFDKRFEVTAQKAETLGLDSFTSTLLTSPKKSLTQLKLSGDRLAKKYNISFEAPDFRKASGTQEQNILAKKDKLYRQDYCGCIYGLTKQREHQDKLADELFSPISKQIQPESIEQRIELYEKRLKLEEALTDYKIIKQRFLNYRLLYGYLKIKNRVVDAHFLPYSTIRGEYSRGKIDVEINDIFYLNRDEVRFITLDKYNILSNSNYSSVLELIFNPPKFKKELKVREQLGITHYDLGAILVVKEIPISKLEIVCQSKTYDDIMEIILSST